MRRNPSRVKGGSDASRPGRLPYSLGEGYISFAWVRVISWQTGVGVSVEANAHYPLLGYFEFCNIPMSCLLLGNCLSFLLIAV